MLFFSSASFFVLLILPLLSSANVLFCSSPIRKTLFESSDIQKDLSRTLLNHELEVERSCLSPLTALLEVDMPNVSRHKKLLNTAIKDMDSYRKGYQTALKQSHQSGPAATSAAANKADTLKKEWEESTTKVEQTKVCQCNLFIFLFSTCTCTCTIVDG